VKNSVFPGRSLWRARRDYLALLLVSLTFLHGLVVCPLLVECIREDGTTRIELMGQDPCRHPRDAGESCLFHDFASAALGATNSGEPCVDLALESLAVSQKSLDSKSLPSPSMNASADVTQAGMCFPSALHPGTIFKLARDPADFSACNCLLTFSLRI
jgi:hypothetical protein